MTFLSTNPIELNVNSDGLFNYLTNLENGAEIFKFKKVKHFKFENNKIGFILKWASVFNYEIGETTKDYVQYDSVKGDPFLTAIRFEIKPKANKSELIINYQADTTPYMRALFELKVQRLITQMVDNFKVKFN